MGNVVQLRSQKTPETIREPVEDFIQNELMIWAERQGIDINSRKFKYSAACIMTCLQGMLLDV